MTKLFLLVILFLDVIFLFTPSVKAQAFGFGCLGFVGGYGGYSYQIYQPTEFNDYIDAFNLLRKDSLSSPMSHFGKAKGYRVGVNLFRADFSGFILTAKGFYQKLTEKKDAFTSTSFGSTNTTFEVDLKNWGVGIDLGTTLTGALSWKVIDAAILFNTATLTTTVNAPGAITEVHKFNSEKASLGYTVGTGFIFAIIKEYITLEGVAGYTVFSIEKMKYDEGVYLTVTEKSDIIMQKFIETGGFNAVIQLNIGFPL